MQRDDGIAQSTLDASLVSPEFRRRLIYFYRSTPAEAAAHMDAIEQAVVDLLNSHEAQD